VEEGKQKDAATGGAEARKQVVKQNGKQVERDMTKIRNMT
jgi:hypothetical protein